MKSIQNVLLVLFSLSLAGGVVFAAAGPTRHALKTLDDIVAAPEGNLDLLEAVLLISRDAIEDLDGIKVSSGESRQQVERMVNQVSKSVAEAEEPFDKLRVLNRCLFEREKFQAGSSSIENSLPDELFIDRVIKNHKGTCLSLSLLYLSLGERLGLPLSAVSVPDHFFVRWDDGEVQINVETTQQGEFLPDEFYKLTHGQGRPDILPLKPLTKRQVAGIFLSNVANEYKQRGKYEESIVLYRKALALAPDNPTIMTNLGNAYERMGWIDEAIAQYERSLNIDPLLCETHYNLGLAHFLYTKRFDLALIHGRVAEKIGCPMHPAFKDFLEKNKQP